MLGSEGGHASDDITCFNIDVNRIRLVFLKFRWISHIEHWHLVYLLSQLVERDSFQLINLKLLHLFLLRGDLIGKCFGRFRYLLLVSGRWEYLL